jgi:hypothetical protein
MKRIFRNVFLFGCFILLLPHTGQCLRPVIQYHDLVAGNGEYGFRDGPFYSAEFNFPIGIALNADDSILYVADQRNNLIRAILLKEKNRVITVVGTVNPGRLDGPLTIASFNKPKDLAFLPDNQIAVFDQGNQLIRLIDLNKEMVSTLAGGGKSGQTDGDALKVQLGAIGNLVYYDKDRCLYFSLPDTGILQSLNLESGKISTILKGNSLLPHPNALCVSKGKFYIADRELPQVYEFSPPPLENSLSVSINSASIVSLHQVGQASTTIIGLAGSDKCLYAYQSNGKFPIFRLFPNSAPVSFASAWGYLMAVPGQLPALQALQGQMGFIFDPRSVDRFYITNPIHSFIGSMRDYASFPNPDGLESELEYPYSKPPETFRILVCGRSQLRYQEDERIYYKPEEADQVESTNPLTSIPKRMELELNTRAALTDNPTHFEVLGNCLRAYNLIIESYRSVPKLCGLYDFDLVLITKDDLELERTLQYLFLRPIDSDGVPESQSNPDFAPRQEFGCKFSRAS